ncbi:MAG: SseB family protein [Chloroflexi bacterium]|nr:SseB family protein [Chloroflexota bacterium]
MSADEPRPTEDAPGLDALIDADLVVPIRSSTGATPDHATLDASAFRHGTDDAGERFIAAFTSPGTMAELGPPGSDSIRIPARLLFERADAAQERVVVDPGAPTQVEVAVGVLPFLAAGIDPNRPDALRARRPLGDLPSLEVPEQIPEPFGRELLAAFGELPQVERAWLLRAGTAWTAGIQLRPDALLADFDAVRNRLHAVATEHLGSRRLLAVTDLRAPALRDMYDATAAPFYVRHDEHKSLLSRLLGG